MDACPHYIGMLTPLRHPVKGERFKSPPSRTCVCGSCGICLGWRARYGSAVGFNPILTAAQRDSVHRFLTGHGIRVDA